MISQYIFRTLLTTFLLISFLSCSNEGQQETTEETEILELPAEGITIEDTWARPGQENGVSAIYMNVLNGSPQADSIISLSSPAAGLTEVHETYEEEDGMMGMREAKNLEIPARDILRLEPGGLHIMLMQLNSTLTEGDEVELTIQFANTGEMNITVPVQLMD